MLCVTAAKFIKKLFIAFQQFSWLANLLELVKGQEQSRAFFATDAQTYKEIFEARDALKQQWHLPTFSTTLDLIDKFVLCTLFRAGRATDLCIAVCDWLTSFRCTTPWNTFTWLSTWQGWYRSHRNLEVGTNKYQGSPSFNYYFCLIIVAWNFFSNFIIADSVSQGGMSVSM